VQFNGKKAVLQILCQLLNFRENWEIQPWRLYGQCRRISSVGQSNQTL